nr:phosphatidylserine/phosphatidylglycerophosphate/cardiolipin synthase family protein [uncultured Sphingomonas sp.]
MAEITATIDGNSLALIPDGARRRTTLVDLIDGAADSLRLLYYMFTEDEAGEEVRDALVRAAARGVSIQVLVDGFGSVGIRSEFFGELEATGGNFTIFHPSYGRRYLIRNHQKLAIADEQVALVGGANVNLQYLEDDSDDRWRDLWLRVDGPAAAALARYFDDIDKWTKQKTNRFRDLRRIIHRHSNGDGLIVWRFSGPMRRRNPFPAALAQALEGASRFDAVVAYFSPSWAMLRRIYRVAGRGTARIVNAARSDNQTTIAAARYLYSRLLRRGVEVYEYQPAKLHTKLYIVDDITFIGSSNFDFRSLYINLEMMLRIEDKGFADQMRAFVDHEIADSVRITPDLHRARTNWLIAIKRWVAHWLVTTVDYTVSRRFNVGLE